MDGQSRLGALRLDREDAGRVGELIELRTKDRNVVATPLAALPAFGRRLSRAAARRRRPGATLAIWDVPRGEALAGFHYLALFDWPAVPESFLDDTERAAVGRVLRALGAALTAKRGRKRLTRQQAEQRIRGAELTPDEQRAVGEDADAGDRRFAQRLKARVSREDAMAQALANQVPTLLLDLLSPPRFPRN